ncbi:MAG: lysoplasmalogenase, partial [Ginsengibacter sp.]
MKTTHKLLSLFVIISLVYLICSLLNFTQITFYLKPLLLLPLMSISLLIPNFLNKKILFSALLFSWIGDILLLFVFKDALYFILGLIFFLTAHIFYIFLFVKELKLAGGKFTFRSPGLIFVLVYMAIFLSLLVPHLGNLLIPVIIYSIVISAMLYVAYLEAPHLPKRSSALLLSGAISFVISDSILAIDKFYYQLSYAGFLIMLTYLYAQGALVWAFLKKN